MEERVENRLLEKERMCGVSVDSHLWGYRLERVCVRVCVSGKQNRNNMTAET